jgi:putative hemolysin
MDRLLLLRVLIVVLLVAANAFFVASEFALVSVRETRIRRLIDQGNFAARSVLRLHTNMDQLLAAVQLGVTLTSLALGWVGEPAIAALFERAFVHLPHAAFFAHTVAVIIAFCCITYVHVILGEIVPKQLTLNRADRVALAIAPPMEVFMRAMQPFTALMSRSANLVLKLFHTPAVREGTVHSAEELKMLVSASRNLGFLPPAQELMVRRALELDDVTAREIMTPRQNVFSVPADMSLEQAETRMMEEQHSRVPVYDPNVGPEQVIGLLYSKDVARYMHRRLTRSGPRIPLTVRHVMRDVMVVPETKIVTDLLQDLKHYRRHLAAVVDEFGTTVGIVTVEDALEQLVGEIEDEFDMPDAPTVSLLAAGAVVLDGAENIRDIEDNMQLVLPKDAGYETLAGFVLDQLGHIPHEGENFEFEGRRYTVLEMQKLRIGKVKVEASADADATPAPSAQEAER